MVADKLGKDIEVNWSSPRVVLVSQGFDDRTKVAVEEVDYVDLITYTPYSQDILYLETVYSPNKTQPLKEQVKKRDEETYDNDYHLNLTAPQMQKIAQELRGKILELPSVEEKTGQKTGITYRTTKSFARLEFRKSWIQLLLRHPNYPEDTKGLVKDITSNEWGYLGMVKLVPDSDIDYIFSLIKASYNSTL